MLHEALLCQLFVFSPRSAIVGKWEYAYSSTGLEYSRHFDVTWIHELHEVFHYDIDTILMKVAMVAEAEEIQLQALAFHHTHVGNVFYDYLSEVRLSRDRTQRSELRTVELHPIVIRLMLVLECLKHLRRIVLPILRLLAEGMQSLVLSVFAICHTNIFRYYQF